MSCNVRAWVDLYAGISPVGSSLGDDLGLFWDVSILEHGSPCGASAILDLFRICMAGCRIGPDFRRIST